ncbi:MAG: TIGR03032 family protein, partial [Planctomycetaceae bacterium]|nr:TIGR03032 family protein [Planctomycetaceae bacterium]
RPWLRLMGLPRFTDWLADENISLGFSTYQSGKLFLIGRKQDGSMSGFERTFKHCMGLWASADAETLWLTSRYQLWRLRRTPARQDRYPGYDAMYIPRVGYTTGHLDTHDIVVEDDGRVVFVNTMFGCLATISETAGFRPLWRPPFLSALVPEDRCHLNGLALRDGRARYVTVVADCDVTDGWRDRRTDGGCVIDVQSDEIICRGLSMPHSPRWYRDRLWVLNSGRGEFGCVDLATGTFEPVAFCPGYLRGLSFHGRFAVVTLSKPRNITFSGLPLDTALSKRGAEPQCSLQIIDLETGTIAHWLRIDGTVVSEIYDVVVLPNVTRPMAIGFKNDEIEQLIVVEEPAGQLSG